MTKSDGNIGVSPRRRCPPFSKAPKKKPTNYGPLVDFQCRALGLPTPHTEFRFHPTRKWRFDKAWTHPRRVALEIEGGVFVRGRHTRGAAFEADCEKYAEAAILGWVVVRVTPRMVKDGRAVQWLAQLLAPRPPPTGPIGPPETP